MDVQSFAEIETEFLARVHSAVWCNVATVDSQGRPRSRVLHPIWEGSTGWIATRPDSHKARHLLHNPHVSLTYMANVMKPVYVEAIAEWVDDPLTKVHIWNLFKETPPPLGYDPAIAFKAVDDPSYGLLKLAPWRIELYELGTHSAERQVWRA